MFHTFKILNFKSMAASNDRFDRYSIRKASVLGKICVLYPIFYLPIFYYICVNSNWEFYGKDDSSRPECKAIPGNAWD
jgi:hypothetical protein